MNYWVLKTVDDENRSYRSNDGYKDVLSSKYLYDSNVANSQQIKPNDLVVLINKKEVLGYAKISRIKKSFGKKDIRRCPECSSTNYEARKTKLPIYRCNKGHEFHNPITTQVDIKKYEALYGESFKKASPNSSLIPRDYYLNRYNRNMSIQSIDKKYFDALDGNLISKLKESIYYPSPSEAINPKEDEVAYKPNEKDTREKINRQIKARRGQQKFRKNLLDLYQEHCCVTGCNIIHILEAAHIKPYLGENDNHPSNGLLLRADIHTLFDLDLLGIHPETLTIHLNNEIKKSEYESLEGSKLRGNPSKEALVLRWELFEKNK